MQKSIIVAVGSNTNKHEKFSIIHKSGKRISEIQTKLHRILIKKANNEFPVKSSFIKIAAIKPYYAVLNAKDWDYEFAVGLGDTPEEALNSAERQLKENLEIEFVPKYQLIEEEEF